MNRQLPSARLRVRIVLALVGVAIAVVTALVWQTRRPTARMIGELPTIDISNLESRNAEALAKARNAVRMAPSSGEAWGRFANVLWANEFIAEAAVCYERAERLAPREVRWPYLRGLSLERQQPDTALDCIRRAVSLAESLALPRVQLAEMLLGRGELDEAERHLHRALNIDPGDSRILLALGRLAFMKGRIDEALRWTSQAAEIDPGRRRIRLLLCQIHQRRGDSDAVDEQLRVLESLPPVTPNYEWPDPLLAEAARFKNNPAETAVHAQQLIDTGHAQEAIALLNEAGGRHAQNVQVAIVLGKAYLRTGDLALAKDTLLFARERDPKQAPVFFELGNLARVTQQHHEAIEHYHEAVRLEPEYAIAYYYLGLSRRELGDAEGAIDALEHACRCVPENARVQRELAKTLWESGRREQATEHLKEALRIAPDDPESRLLFERWQANDSHVGPTGDDVNSQDSRDPS